MVRQHPRHTPALAAFPRITTIGRPGSPVAGALGFLDQKISGSLKYIEQTIREVAVALGDDVRVIVEMAPSV
jgi:hypothetical protein